MNVKFTLNHKNLAAIDEIAVQSLIKIADAIKTDVTTKSQTMPFDTGTMQKDMTFIDKSQAKDFKVKIVTDTSYARRLYFHPEYHFTHEHNKNAGGKWYDPYIDGTKKDYAQRMFQKYMHSGMKRLGG